MSKLETKGLLFNTRAIHSGSEHCPVTGARIAPIYRTSTWMGYTKVNIFLKE